MDPDAECKHGLYLRDGRRKVDYILVYHPKRPSGSRTLARRVQHGDAAPAARGTRQDQPLPGKGDVGAAGGPEPPMDYHEDDKRFRREEYEGNLLEAGLELERDEEVTVPASCGRAGCAGQPGPRRRVQKAVRRGVLLALACSPTRADAKAAPVKVGQKSLVRVWGRPPQPATRTHQPRRHLLSGRGWPSGSGRFLLWSRPSLRKTCPSPGTEDEALLETDLGPSGASVSQSVRWGGQSGLISGGSGALKSPDHKTVLWSTCPWQSLSIFRRKAFWGE